MHRLAAALLLAGCQPEQFAHASLGEQAPEQGPRLRVEKGGIGGGVRPRLRGSVHGLNANTGLCQGDAVETRVDYDRHQWVVYAQGRALSPGLADLWGQVFGKYMERAARPTILDLGSGVGSYSQLLAEFFDATVVGVEPSGRMRAVAEREHKHPRVRYVEGSAEDIPLPAGACDVALLSQVIHHVRERETCAAELFRVVRPGGLVLIRGTLRESLPSVPFLDFFPTARAVDERRLPSASEVIAMFPAQGFEHIASELIEQETTASFRAYYERVKLRAISTLELISDADFEHGIARMREAAEGETAPRPVIQPINLLVFRRR
jgi:ubiquinone/menaquinone biosynthesis C-methylase UbiE